MEVQKIGSGMGKRIILARRATKIVVWVSI